jgi:hypothetical protein
LVVGKRTASFFSVGDRVNDGAAYPSYLSGLVKRILVVFLFGLGNGISSKNLFVCLFGVVKGILSMSLFFCPCRSLDLYPICDDCAPLVKQIFVDDALTDLTYHHLSFCACVYAPHPNHRGLCRFGGGACGVSFPSFPSFPRPVQQPQVVVSA